MEGGVQTAGREGAGDVEVDVEVEVEGRRLEGED